MSEQLKDHLQEQPLDWLLEPDEADVRYLTLRDLLDTPPCDVALTAAREQAHADSPIAAILDRMDPQGFWAKPDPGYTPKYHSTVWSVILLAQLGAFAVSDPQRALHLLVLLCVNLA